MGRLVLIAEDDLVSRRVLAKFLEKWDYQVVAATNGQDAWAKFEALRPAIVISDWMMPELDGPELVRHIRAWAATNADTAPDTGYVYVMLLTAKSAKEDLLNGLEAGADDFLTKPFDHEELRVRLRAAERIITLEARLAQHNRALAAVNADLRKANVRMRRDLEAAARVQQALLPTRLPTLPGARFAWHFAPCDELAGDLLDIVRLDDRHVGCYVLDVSGHGVAAALLSVTVGRAISRLYQREGLPTPPGLSVSEPPRPAEIAEALLREFPVDEATGQYFTVALATLNSFTGEFALVSAGHPRPIVLPADVGEPPDLLPVAGYPVALIENLADHQYQEYRGKLQVGDSLILYSDGLTDAMTGERELFGEERLMAALAELRGQSPQGLINALLQRVKQWTGDRPPNDDISILVVQSVGNQSGELQQPYHEPSSYPDTTEARRDDDLAAVHSLMTLGTGNAVTPPGVEPCPEAAPPAEPALPPSATTENPPPG